MLETERLVLRKFRRDDFEAVHSYVGCADNLIFMQFGPNSEEETRAFIEMAISSPVHHFAVTLKDVVIGGCTLHYEDGTGEMGWLLHRDYWKQGLGTEIARALLSFGFDELNAHRITARCDLENIGSSKLMEKVGMRREGLFLDARPPNKLSKKAIWRRAALRHLA